MADTHTFESLRDYLSFVDDRGYLKEIEGAHWEQELGALTEAVAFSDAPRPLLFDDITDYPRGFRVATNLFVTERLQAIALGLPEDATGLDQVEAWRDRHAKDDAIPPTEVDDGPVRENVMAGDDVDMYRFPSPLWHEEDGGRYFGTGDAVITRTVDGEWVNVAPYRSQVHDERTLGIFINQVHHGLAHLKQWWGRGEDAPIAVVAGQDPHTYAAGCISLPHGRSELDFAGALKGDPVEVVTHEDTGLPVPATAEIAAFGHVPPPEEESRIEGPFGECTGYYAGEMDLPVIHVDEVWYRDDPIILGLPTMYGPARRFALGAEPTTSAAIWDAIDDEIPNVQGVYTLYQQCQAGSDITVVSIEQAYAGHARQAGVAALGSHHNVIMNSMVIVVDEDINPADLDQVLFALTSRCDPAEDIDTVRGLPSIHLDPHIHPDRKDDGDLTSSAMVVDACKPYHWKDEYPITNRISPKLEREMLEKWDVDNWDPI